ARDTRELERLKQELIRDDARAAKDREREREDEAKQWAHEAKQRERQHEREAKQRAHLKLVLDLGADDAPDAQASPDAGDPAPGASRWDDHVAKRWQRFERAWRRQTEQRERWEARRAAHRARWKNHRRRWKQLHEERAMWMRMGKDKRAWGPWW